ncbi:hypothetical protein Leryth_007751 [Lithospermum erythrorhizon]|nr:hypothetical protein Leryth_007751 [Lithospermum erythrorhizon]
MSSATTTVTCPIDTSRAADIAALLHHPPPPPPPPPTPTTPPSSPPSTSAPPSPSLPPPTMAKAYFPSKNLTQTTLFLRTKCCLVSSILQISLTALCVAFVIGLLGVLRYKLEGGFIFKNWGLVRVVAMTRKGVKMGWGGIWGLI